MTTKDEDNIRILVQNQRMHFAKHTKALEAFGITDADVGHMVRAWYTALAAKDIFTFQVQDLTQPDNIRSKSTALVVGSTTEDESGMTEVAFSLRTFATEVVDNFNNAVVSLRDDWLIARDPDDPQWALSRLAAIHAQTLDSAAFVHAASQSKGLTVFTYPDADTGEDRPDAAGDMITRIQDLGRVFNTVADNMYASCCRGGVSRLVTGQVAGNLIRLSANYSDPVRSPRTPYDHRRGKFESGAVKADLWRTGALGPKDILTVWKNDANDADVALIVAVTIPFLLAPDGTIGTQRGFLCVSPQYLHVVRLMDSNEMEGDLRSQIGAPEDNTDPVEITKASFLDAVGAQNVEGEPSKASLMRARFESQNPDLTLDERVFIKSLATSLAKTGVDATKLPLGSRDRALHILTTHYATYGMENENLALAFFEVLDQAGWLTHLPVPEKVAPSVIGEAARRPPGPADYPVDRVRMALKAAQGLLKWNDEGMADVKEVVQFIVDRGWFRRKSKPVVDTLSLVTKVLADYGVGGFGNMLFYNSKAVVRALVTLGHIRQERKEGLPESTATLLAETRRNTQLPGPEYRDLADARATADKIVDSVDLLWTRAPRWANFAAQDKSGAWYWFAEEPCYEVGGDLWYSDGKSKQVVAKDWKKSLQSRPTE